MKWNNSHNDPPKTGQKVYYFGPNIGLWVGNYKYQLNSIEDKKGKQIELCPHLFFSDAGIVDACDAPYWMEYDEDRETKGWRPIVPKQYTKDLYETREEILEILGKPLGNETVDDTSIVREVDLHKFKTLWSFDSYEEAVDCFNAWLSGNKK